MVRDPKWQVEEECKRFLLANSYNIYSGHCYLSIFFPIKSTCEQKLNIEIIFFTPWPPYGEGMHWKYSRESIKKRGYRCYILVAGHLFILSVQTSEDLLVSFYKIKMNKRGLFKHFWRLCERERIIKDHRKLKNLSPSICLESPDWKWYIGICLLLDTFSILDSEKKINFFMISSHCVISCQIG